MSPQDRAVCAILNNSPGGREKLATKCSGLLSPPGYVNASGPNCRSNLRLNDVTFLVLGVSYAGCREAPLTDKPMNRKLAKDQREALGMLAASLHGRMESVMEAHGATIGTLRGLVRMGLATADRRPAHFKPGAIVTVLQITDAGRQAIAQ
jgi:hypothetical protein